MVRLQNVLSKDSRLIEFFPNSFAEIIKLYYTDLVADEILKEDDKPAKKQLSKMLPMMIREYFQDK